MKKKRRGSSRYFVVFIFLIILLFGGFIGIKRIIQSIGYFNIEKIEVVGNNILEPDFLLNLCNDLIGENLFSVSKKDILKKYENVIRIKDIKVLKIIPGKLKIKIIERKAVFLIKTKEGVLYPVDEDKIILDSNYSFKEILPIISLGLSKNEIIFGKVISNEFIDRIFDFRLSVNSVESKFFNKISEFYEEDEDIYMVELNKGYKIIFGDGEMEDKLKRFMFLEKNRDFERGSIIDLRFKDRLIIRSEEG
ncbi:MAG: FtsQ-type POTRA domain-containing protein [Candidatus Cloacimonetes bacterium]|jgi:cell division septal protein FtsQ|nr:FtsQ-type POTRA domain-containing protein [Candidatus Cloacimonadota bacterium]